MDPYQNDQLEQAVAQVKRRTSSLCSTPSTPTSTSHSWSRPQTPQNEPLTPPDIVLLGLWPYATDEQIDFYLDGYNIIYPNANVVPIRHGRHHHDATLEILTRACEKPASEKQPQMLLHLFGNDGAAHVVDLLRSFRIRTGQTLPIQAVIMDSIPAMPVPSLNEAIESPQRLLILTYTTLWTMYIFLLSFLTLGHSDTASERLRSGLHDPTLVPSDARKVYIWAARDIMFSWKSSSSRSGVAKQDCVSNGAVVLDNDECESYEYAVKRSTVDEKGRWTGNQERYWLGIENAWESGGSL